MAKPLGLMRLDPERISLVPGNGAFNQPLSQSIEHLKHRRLMRELYSFYYIIKMHHSSYQTPHPTKHKTLLARGHRVRLGVPDLAGLNHVTKSGRIYSHIGLPTLMEIFIRLFIIDSIVITR